MRSAAKDYVIPPSLSRDEGGVGRCSMEMGELGGSRQSKDEGNSRMVGSSSSSNLATIIIIQQSHTQVIPFNPNQASSSSSSSLTGQQCFSANSKQLIYFLLARSTQIGLRLQGKPEDRAFNQLETHSARARQWLKSWTVRQRLCVAFSQPGEGFCISALEVFRWVSGARMLEADEILYK